MWIQDFGHAKHSNYSTRYTILNGCSINTALDDGGMRFMLRNMVSHYFPLGLAFFPMVSFPLFVDFLAVFRNS
jgi:hypothetical protein